MKPWDGFLGAIIALAVLCTTFFVVFAFHAYTPDQLHAKAFLDGVANNTPFTDAEHAHMEDVRHVLSAMRIITALLIIATCWALYRRTRAMTVFAGTTLISLVLALALIDWNTLFSGFHLILFPQGNWMFPAQSHIIQTYPHILFVRFASIWAGLCVSIGAWLVMWR